MKLKNKTAIATLTIIFLAVAAGLYSSFRSPVRAPHTFVCRARMVIKNNGYTLYTLLNFHLGHREGVATLSGYLEDEQHQETTINRYIHFIEQDRGEGKQLQSERIVPAVTESVSPQALDQVLPDFFTAQGHLLTMRRTWSGENSMMILVSGFPAILCD